MTETARLGWHDSGWTSPLREVERAAQDRAKADNLDMSEPGAGGQLRALLVDEVANWRDEYRKGRRQVDIADPDAAVDRALRNLTGYGPLDPLLDDPDVWEIMIARSTDWGFRRKCRSATL